MGRSVEKQLVEIYGGWSVLMTARELELWNILSRVPYGTMVSSEAIKSEMGITTNQLHVLKSHLTSLLSWGIKFISVYGGYMVEKLH